MGEAKERIQSSMTKGNKTRFEQLNFLGSPLKGYCTTIGYYLEVKFYFAGDSPYKTNYALWSVRCVLPEIDMFCCLGRVEGYPGEPAQQTLYRLEESYLAWLDKMRRWHKRLPGAGTKQARKNKYPRIESELSTAKDPNS
jgi:hypothetical protein